MILTQQKCTEILHNNKCEYPLIKGIMALKDVDSRVFTRMLRGKNLTR